MTVVRFLRRPEREFIPRHRHSESTDHYFVLLGTLSISMREAHQK
jgi:hypothetical protein